MSNPSATDIAHELIEFVFDVASMNGYIVSIGSQGVKSFQKKTEENWTSFGFGILDYGEVKTITGFSAAINLPKLEKITHPILKEFHLMGGETKEFRQSFWPPQISFENDLNALQYSERESLSKIFGPYWEFQKAALLHLFKNERYRPFIDVFCAKREKIFQEYPDEEIAVQYYQASFALRETLSKNQ